MFVDSQGNPQSDPPVTPLASPQETPAASVPPNPQSTPPASPASAMPQEPEPKKDGPKKKEESISIRPNFLLSAVFQALNLFIIIAVLVLVLRVVGIDLQKDVINVILEAFDQLVVTSNDLGGVPMFGLLLGQLRETIVFTFIQVVILALILQIPVVNNHWRIFSDRLEYKKGFILLKTKTIWLSDVKNVSFKSYTPFADFGKVILEFSGGEGKGIEMPYISHASKLTAEINTRVKQHQMKVAAVLAKNAPPTTSSETARPASVPPQ